MTEHNVTGISDDSKMGISYLSAVDMAIGEAVTRNKYLLIGGAIGVLGTTLTIGIYKKYKNRKNTVEEEKAE